MLLKLGFRVNAILVAAIAVILAAPSVAAADPFAGTEWRGEFTCGRNQYSFTLTIPEGDGSEMRAGTVRFETAQGVGEYSVRGRINGREFLFLPDAWIERVAGTDAVGFKGTLHENGLVLNGEIRGCPAASDFPFVAERATDETVAFGEVEARAIGKTFTGEWQGEINCANRRMKPLPVSMTLVQQGSVVGGKTSFAWAKPDGRQSTALMRGEVDESGEVSMARVARPDGISRTTDGMTGRLASRTGAFEGVIELPASWGECRFSVERQGPPDVPDLAALGLQGVWAGIRGVSAWQIDESSLALGSVRQVRLMLSEIEGQPIGTFEVVGPVSAPPIRQDRFQLSIFPILMQDEKHLIFVPLAVLRADGMFADMTTDIGFMVKVPEGPAQDSRLAIQMAVGQAARFTTKGRFGDLPPQGPQALAAMFEGEGPAFEFPGEISGSIAEAPSIDAQCRIFVEWAKPYLRALEEGARYRHEIEALSATMFTDAAFEPVFGLPFAFTSKEERDAINHLGGYVCEPRLGVAGFRSSSFGGMLGPGYMDMVATGMNREEAAAWVAEAAREVGQLEAEPDNLMRLLEIEGEATRRKSEIEPEAMQGLMTAIADLRAAIDVVVYMREVDGVPSLPEDVASLPRLAKLAKRAPDLRLTDVQRGQARDAIEGHVRTIVGRRLSEIRESHDAVQADFEGLAVLTTKTLQLAELARQVEPPLHDARIGEAKREIDARRQSLWKDERVQRAFEVAANNLQASRMRPNAAVYGWASNFLLADELDHAPAVYRNAIHSAVARLEMAAINIKDHSQGGPAGQPTADEMALALKRQVDALNASLAARHTSCHAGGFRDDPLAAMECLVILGAGGGERWETYLTHFEKLGCAAGAEGSGYLCDFSAGIASTSPLMQGRLGEILSAGETNRGRFLRSKEGWQYIKQRVVIVR